MKNIDQNPIQSYMRKKGLFDDSGLFLIYLENNNGKLTTLMRNIKMIYDNPDGFSRL